MNQNKAFSGRPTVEGIFWYHVAHKHSHHVASWQCSNTSTLQSACRSSISRSSLIHAGKQHAKLHVAVYSILLHSDRYVYPLSLPNSHNNSSLIFGCFWRVNRNWCNTQSSGDWISMSRHVCSLFVNILHLVINSLMTHVRWLGFGTTTQHCLL